jgi:hypothetical protein
MNDFVKRIQRLEAERGKTITTEVELVSYVKSAALEALRLVTTLSTATKRRCLSREW